jgi:hypothetical protein
MVWYLKAISETHMPWRLTIASCIGYWAEEIKEMLKTKQEIPEIEKMERKQSYEI